MTATEPRHASRGAKSLPLAYRRIFSFWLPLAGTWLMMAVEGPYLAAIIARLPDAVPNLAAFGVAFAFAIIIESPVIMLMSASTALVEDAASFRALRRFALGLAALVTVVQVVVLLPPVFNVIARTLQLPAEVADLTHGALAILLPWPGAIAYRRFRQGLLIRHHQTRRVAYGTGIRLAAMSLTALAAFLTSELPGAWVGALGLTPLYVKNARGSTTARSVRGELKALASLGSRSPRTVNHGRQPAARVLRCAPALRVTAAADRAGSPCAPAGRLALDPLPGSATPASHSVVAENRRQTPEWDRVHLPDRGFAVARTIRKHAVGILAYLDTRMTERARGRTHPARPTG